MNYYPFHLGDYAAHTGHLEPMEDLAYRRLLDQYYMREGPLPIDVQVTAKLVRMRSMVSDVESVLREFFTLTDLGWTHSRCDAEIEKMQDKQAKARASGIASANARKSYAERASQAKPKDDEEKSTDVERSLGDQSTDVQLPTPTPTPTPTPIKERERTPTGSRLPPDWLLPDEWADWAKQARPELNPNETAQRFADYWHGVAGAKGRKVDWLATWRNWVRNEKAPPMSRSQAMSFSERDEQARRRRWEEMTGRKWPETYDPTTIDVSTTRNAPMELEQ